VDANSSLSASTLEVDADNPIYLFIFLFFLFFRKSIVINIYLIFFNLLNIYIILLKLRHIGKIKTTKT
jgi:hypothetical protein